LGHVKPAGEVYPQYGVPIVNRHLSNSLVDRDASVVDQDIHAAALRQDLVDNAPAIFGYANIALMDGDRAALRGEGRRKRLGDLGARAVTDGYVITRPGK